MAHHLHAVGIYGRDLRRTVLGDGARSPGNVAVARYDRSGSTTGVQKRGAGLQHARGHRHARGDDRRSTAHRVGQVKAGDANVRPGGRAQRVNDKTDTKSGGDVVVPRQRVRLPDADRGKQ